MTKYKQAKKCNTDFAILKGKKTATAWGKKDKHQNNLDTKSYCKSINKHARKSASTGFKSPNKPGQRR